MRLKITICLGMISFLAALIGYQLFIFSDKKLHVVFCDVGQGDAILMRTPQGNDILIDGGPGSNVLPCLRSHMPFWDTSLDLIILSHPHSDHYEGLIDVVKDYQVKEFAREDLINTTQGYRELERRIKERTIPTRILFAGDSYTFGGVVIDILAPTQAFIKETSPNNIVGEKGEFASVIPLITYQATDILLTGDTQSRALLTALRDTSMGRVQVIQVPHHGSKTGLTQDILTTLQPQLAVISVGEKNRYNHPASSTITLLQKNKVEIRMTKDSGDIELVSDGKKILLRR